MTLLKNHARTLLASLLAILPNISEAQVQSQHEKIKIKTVNELDQIIEVYFNADPRLLHPVQKQGLLEALKEKGIVEQVSDSRSSDCTSWTCKN